MARASVTQIQTQLCELAILKQDPGMRDILEELHRFREQVVIARAEALRFGHTRLAECLAQSVTGIDLVIAEFDESFARTWTQVEALKRLIGAT